MNKYNIGDKVRIKSIEWYNQNKEEHGLIINDAEESNVFCSGMSLYCGRELTVKAIDPDGRYSLTDNDGIGDGDLYTWSWEEWMFEE
ncbi:hypothetical protein [Parabacteroides leei]|uniref:hypothetical protein n=1 Tax=Parabacteroides leei TaxID=2939491 RepID=UPI00189B5ED7|nr:hypothetical protein [Parabacteroides goldsteinii]